MKKAIYQLIALSAALLPVLSCEKEHGGDGGRAEGIKVTVSCENIATRTEVQGTGSENLIKTVDYFVFSVDGDGNPVGGYTYRGTHEANLESTCTFYIEATYVDNANYRIYSIANYPGQDRATDFGALQSTAGTTKTYADLQDLLVSERALTNGNTAVIAAPTFTAVTGRNIDPAPESSRSFIMTGLSEVFEVSSSGTGNIKGETSVQLKRLAAKVDMEFYVRNSLRVEKDEGRTIEVWTPMIDGGNIRLSLNRAVEDAYLGGGDIGAAVSYFDYAPNYDNTVGAEVTKEGVSCTTMTSAPFYTYPKPWQLGDDDEPFLKLIIPWKLTRTVNAGGPGETTTTSQKELYYKIVLPKEMDGQGFESNHWYRLEVYISQLGSDADEPEVSVICGYKVIDWAANPGLIIAKLVQGLYLDVSNGTVKEENGQTRVHYTMYSTDPIEIPFIAAQGGVTAQDKTMTFSIFKSSNTSSIKTEVWELSSLGWTRLSGDTGTSTHGRYETASYLNTIIQVDEDKEVVRIDHPLNTNYNGDAYDVSPFTFEFTLHLNNDTDGLYDKYITVTQYPPLYIQVNPHGQSKSDGTVVVNGTINDHPGTTTGTKDVYDDSGTTGKSVANAPYYLGSASDYEVVGSGSANGNNNPNLYKVSASILDLTMTIDGVSKQMVLGDPREPESTYANDKLKGVDGSTIDGDLNGLAGYRKTAEDRKNFVSPSLLIASSYGKTRSTSYEGALKRCATYQEDGYPAGRWRLPTMAEIEFLIKLSDNGKIPELFTVSRNNGYNDGYWAAGKEMYTIVRQTGSGNSITETKGFVDLSSLDVSAYNTTTLRFYYTGPYTDGNNSTTRNYAGFARCVYDAWYWGDETDRGYTRGLNDGAGGAGTDLGYKTTRQ